MVLDMIKLEVKFGVIHNLAIDSIGEIFEIFFNLT